MLQLGIGPIANVKLRDTGTRTRSERFDLDWVRSIWYFKPPDCMRRLPKPSSGMQPPNVIEDQPDAGPSNIVE